MENIDANTLRQDLIEFLENNSITVAQASAMNQPDALDQNSYLKLKEIIELNKTIWRNWHLDLNKGKIILRENSKEIIPYDKRKVKEIFSNSKIMDLCKDHNQVLDVYKAGIQQDKINPDKPLTLIHFDTHSDIVMDQSFNERIGSWINSIIKDGRVSEIYWVLPDWTKNKEVENLFWGEGVVQTFKDKNGETQEVTKIVFPFGSEDWTFYVDRESREEISLAIPDDYNTNPEKYNTVTLRKVTLKDLPQLSGKDNIHLDFCGDYFSLGGIDFDANYNLSSVELANNFNSVIEELHRKNIKPVITTMAISKEYIPEEDICPIKAFFQDIVKNSGQKDYLIGYQHLFGKKAFNPKKQNVIREGDPAKEVLFDLDCIDTQSKDPNGTIALQKSDEKYDSAIQAIMDTFRINTKKLAEDILQLFDELDGKKDGIINIEEAEENVSQTDIIDSLKSRLSLII